MRDDEVKSLAANLFNKKLAHSMYDAMEKAKSILNIKSQKDIDEDLDFRMSRDVSAGKNEQKNEQPAQNEKFAEELKDLEGIDASAQAQSAQKDEVKYGVDIPDAAAKNDELTLNELMQQADIDLAEIEAAERAKLQKIEQETEIIKDGLKEAEQNPEVIEQVKEEISEVKEELKELEEEKAKQQQSKEVAQDSESPEAQEATEEPEITDEELDEADFENKEEENKAD